MRKLAICNETFPDLDWVETCRFVAQTGYDGIEIAPFTLGKDVRDIPSHARRAYRATAERNGLAVVGLHWLLVSPQGLSLTTPDDALRGKTAAYLAALADFCADIGGQTLVLGSPNQRRIAGGETAQTATARLMRSLEPALIRCQTHGLTLCLEPLPAPEADLILTLAAARDVIARLAHPNLRTILDIKSASSEPGSISTLIADSAADIAHVHANDADRRGPGFGDTDFVPIFTALDTIGYEGWVSVEVFDYAPDPTVIARQSLAYLKQCEQQAQQRAISQSCETKPLENLS